MNQDVAPCTGACAAECPICGEANRCQLASTSLHKGPCWCGELTLPAERLRHLPEHARGRCLCRRCLEALELGPDAPPVAGRDFYLDPDRRFVFSVRYLLRRGRCCESGCRHCPWKTLLITLVLLILVPVTHAQTSVGWEESFGTDPFTQGWEATGETNFVIWQPAAGHLEVTWNSSNMNSYFRRPLPRPLTATNDFQLTASFTLILASGGVHPGRPGPFQIAFGLQRRAEADAPGFLRGTATASPNLVEWNWFPDTGFGATISPVIVSQAGRFFPAFAFPEELTPGRTYSVSLRYSAATRTLRTRTSPAGEIADVVLPAGEDFLVDAFAIASYSDAGQAPPFGGSIRARGVFHDFSVWSAEPGWPELTLTLEGRPAIPRLRWNAAPGWRYAVERTPDLMNWSLISSRVPAAPGPEVHGDVPPPAAPAFYRLAISPESASGVVGRLKPPP
ncbi:MAG: cysteine-rich CWC family protein [Limisphaerales bacterium]